MSTTTSRPTLATLLPDDLTVGEPDLAGPLALFPLHARPDAREYLSFVEASAHGCTVHELEPASVNDVVVDNPLDVPVLLFEGEEIQGAQQDRTVDLTVLVPARTRLPIAVSCVEAGRWDGCRGHEGFAPSAHTAYPTLRAVKNRRVRAALADGLHARADQAEVWAEVDAKAERMNSHSDTAAMGDIYAARADHLAGLEARLSRRDGQVGALAFLGTRPVVLDYVSRPDVFAGLWPPLVRGYCLDALEQETVAGPLDPAAWLETLLAAGPQWVDGPGLGSTITFASSTVGGAALALEGQLVQLSAFAADGDAPHAHRILRPSRRR